MKTEGGNEILGYFGRFGLISIPPEANSGDDGQNHCGVNEDAWATPKGHPLIGDSERMPTKAALARLRRALRISVPAHRGHKCRTDKERDTEFSAGGGALSASTSY